MIRRPDLDDLDREIRDHIEAETLDHIARGMSESDARAAAIRKFGNVTRVKEDVRGVWIPMWVDHLRQDARDAWRSVRRSPGFSFAIVVTLALGIGLTTAIYSVVNAVLLRPLDYAHPDRVVWLTTKGKGDRGAREGAGIMNGIDFVTWQTQATLLEHVVAYGYNDSTFVIGGEAARLRVVAASDGFWQMTGAQPLLGTLPAAGNPPAIALSHRVFREQFHGDASIIGQAITIDGRPATVAAILPADFRPQLVPAPFQSAFERIEVGAYRIRPTPVAPQTIGPTTGVEIVQALAELKPGVTLQQARAEIETIHARRQREHPLPFGDSSAIVTPLRDEIVGPSRLALEVLLSASIIVLLIACANVANLLLSRSSERRKEIALRMSVGSSPMRVIRQLLAESLAYAILGGVGGVMFAYWLLGAVIAFIGLTVPRLIESRLDVEVLAVTAAISIGTALLFGVGPAMALVVTNVQEVLKEGGRSVSASRRVLITGRIMAAAQIALTIILLTAAALMLKSVWQMTRYPDGFAPDRILTMRMDFRGPQFRDQNARHALTSALLEKANTLPGVRDVALTTGRESTVIIAKEGQPFPPPEQRAALEAALSSISPGFGPMLGMPLVRGRWLTDHDAPGDIVINETLARRDFQGVDPIGQRVRNPYGERNPSGPPDSYATIVGVARDFKYAAIDQDAAPEVFFNHRDTTLFSIMLMLKTDGDPLTAAPAIRKALSTVDPTQSLYSIRTMEAALEESIGPRRFNLLLLGTFAIVALMLAVLGVYGVVAYAVAERTQEIGIRLALGADRARVVRMIVAQGMSGIAIGIVAGVAGAWAATKLMTSLLYGVQPHDLATFAMTTIALSAVALIACAAPALKAALVDPVIALRAE
jgi:putative ABC transport system permease protein